MRRYLPIFAIFALALCAAVVFPSCSWIEGVTERVKGRDGRDRGHGDQTLVVTTTEESREAEGEDPE